MAGNRKGRRLLLLIDLMALAAAFFLAAFIRFHKKPGMAAVADAYDGLYYLIFELILAIYVAVFFVNGAGGKPLSEQNPFEKVRDVVRNQLEVTICLVVLLYLLKRGFWASRAVVTMLAVFGTVFDTALRFLYGSFLKKRELKEKKAKGYLLISDGSLESRLPMIEKLAGNDVLIVDRLTADRLSEKTDTANKDEYDGVLVFLTGYSPEKRGRKELLKHIEGLNTDKPVHYILNINGNPVSGDMAGSIGEFVTACRPGPGGKCSVLKVGFSVTNLTDAVLHVRENLAALKGRYICFGNVHTSVMAYEDEGYRGIQNGAAFVMPDGDPIHKEQQRKGYGYAGRVAGPDFMGLMFLYAMDGSVPMYFYGSTEGTIGALRERLKADYPGLDVRGYESPPFRELTEDEDKETIERINASGAEIVWVGLGAPKQERWMKAHEGRINALMLGVGAGFDFHAGTVRRAPAWVQGMGMEWLYRLLQDPGRLFTRYLITNTKFFFYRLMDK